MVKEWELINLLNRMEESILIYEMQFFLCLYINEPKDQNESFLHKMFKNYK